MGSLLWFNLISIIDCLNFVREPGVTHPHNLSFFESPHGLTNPKVLSLFFTEKSNGRAWAWPSNYGAS